MHGACLSFLLVQTTVPSKTSIETLLYAYACMQTRRSSHRLECQQSHVSVFDHPTFSRSTCRLLLDLHVTEQREHRDAAVDADKSPSACRRLAAHRWDVQNPTVPRHYDPHALQYITRMHRLVHVGQPDMCVLACSCGCPFTALPRVLDILPPPH